MVLLWILTSKEKMSFVCYICTEANRIAKITCFFFFFVCLFFLKMCVRGSCVTYVFLWLRFSWFHLCKPDQFQFVQFVPFPHLLSMTFAGESDKTGFTFKAFMLAEQKETLQWTVWVFESETCVRAFPRLFHFNAVSGLASVSIMTSDSSVWRMPTPCCPAQRLRGNVFFISQA